MANAKQGWLGEGEVHPAAHSAKRFISAHKPEELMSWAESFASNAIEGSRLGEVCGETLDRLMTGQPVSDRYILGLAWIMRDYTQEEITRRFSRYKMALLGITGATRIEEAHWLANKALGPDAKLPNPEENLEGFLEVAMEAFVANLPENPTPEYWLARSAARLAGLVDAKAPACVIENEKRLLLRRIEKLPVYDPGYDPEKWKLPEVDHE